MNKTSLLLGLLLPLSLSAQTEVNYEVGMTVNTGDSKLAPHYIMANRGGAVTQQHGAQLHGAMWHDMDTASRLSWGAGIELWGGWASDVDYARGLLAGKNPQHPARFWVQQAYAEAKHRGVRLVLGAKRHTSPMVDERLSSGDLTWSANARPMPGARAGFVNFQNVPFTNGWLQINGEVGYYKSTDSDWLKHHYNHVNHFITTGWWLNYKYLHLRTNPAQPLVATVGMQAACQFGGTWTSPTATLKQKADAEAFFKALIPGSGGNNVGDQNYVEGNHLGTWDVRLDYRLSGGHRLATYHQHIWEDGSGIGLRNGFDGLWGLDYHAPGRSWIDGAAIEYLDLTNQSGPIHWAPGDHGGTPMTAEATGGDDYYNNYAFSGYQAYGLAMGSPLALSPIYNTMGYMRFVHNRVRAVHAAVAGHITPQWAYRLMAQRRAAWGTSLMPMKRAASTSLMAQVDYTPAAVPELLCTLVLATDHGTLTHDNVGAMLTVTYSGNLTLGK